MDSDESLQPLSPTPRTTVLRGKKNMVGERTALHTLLEDAPIAHVGLTVSADGADHPLVLPMAFAVDFGGPDDGGTLYLHGWSAAGWVRRLPGRTVCVTVTELDGLVASRSAFHHSMNFRSAVVIGTARAVPDHAERRHALDLIVDHMIPGRSATLRATTGKEVAKTGVIAVPLREASVKVRAGGPKEEPEDVAAGGWGGHIPVRRVTGEPVPDADAAGPVPAEVARRAAGR